MGDETVQKTSSKEKHLEGKKFRQFFWRSWAIQASWNYERQMDMGFLYGIAPTLDRLYPNDSDPEQRRLKKEAYQRHMAFYNCTPQTSSFVLGLSASMEEQYAKDRENFNPDTINAVKTSLMGPLSGIGDSFFQGTLRVIAFGVGISLAKQGSILGPIIAMLISFVPSWLITYYGGKIGYRVGGKYLQDLRKNNVMDKVLYVCGIVGLMVVGAMVASMVGLTTPVKFATGGLVLQKVLDQICPGMISIGITMLLYWMVKKNVSTGWILAACIAGGILFSVLGVFS